MTLADELRALAGRLDDTDAGLVMVSAWRMDRLVSRLAKSLGQSEAWVRLSEGLDEKRPQSPARPSGGHRDTREGAIAPEKSLQTAPRRGNA